MFRGLKAWIRTRKNDESDLNDLMDAVRFENRVKRLISMIWTVLIGFCSIIAAVFSVLSFFKD